MAWKPGESGNPNGKPIGARKRLAESFLETVQEDWKQNGKAALVKVREEDASTYLRVVASLIPKDMTLTVHRSAKELSDDELNDIIARGGDGTAVAPTSPEGPSAVH